MNDADKTDFVNFVIFIQSSSRLRSNGCFHLRNVPFCRLLVAYCLLVAHFKFLWWNNFIEIFMEKWISVDFRINFCKSLLWTSREPTSICWAYSEFLIQKFLMMLSDCLWLRSNCLSRNALVIWVYSFESIQQSLCNWVYCNSSATRFI